MALCFQRNRNIALVLILVTLQAVDEVHCLSYTLRALSARILTRTIGTSSGIRFNSIP